MSAVLQIKWEEHVCLGMASRGKLIANLALQKVKKEVNDHEFYSKKKKMENTSKFDKQYPISLANDQTDTCLEKGLRGHQQPSTSGNSEYSSKALFDDHSDTSCLGKDECDSDDQIASTTNYSLLEDITPFVQIEFIGMDKFNLNLNDINVNSSLDVGLINGIAAENLSSNIGENNASEDNNEQPQLVAENVPSPVVGDGSDDDGGLYEPTLSEEDDSSEDTPPTTIDENNTTNHIRETPHKRKRSKRGRPKRDTWTQEKNKSKRRKGEQYFGRRKTEEGKIVFDVQRSKREIKPRCLCNNSTKRGFKCFNITEEKRKHIFESFWNLNWGERKVLVRSVVDKKPVAQRRVGDKESRRNSSLLYHLKPDASKERQKVCKTMFLHTLGIGEWTVLNWLTSDNTQENDNNSSNVQDSEKNLNDNENNGNDEENQPNKKREQERLQREVLKQFFDSLPQLESHYCRKNTSKMYLEPKWQTKSELYRVYESYLKERGKENLKSSMFTFHNVFEDCNLSLFSPKKDQCDICCSFQTGNLSQDEYNIHVKRKEEAREQKEADKTESDEKTAVFTMDMQAVLLSPSLNASALYYRTKLKVHNFSIFNLKNHDAFCYLWDESEGGLNADEFASIICHFIMSEIDQIKYDNIILYSDGCTYQNRNSILSNALLLVSKKTGLTITQKFLEKGHTQMECDSIHSMVEKRLKNREIYSPAGYFEACRSARSKPKPYKVEYLYNDFFLNYSNLKYLTSIRPGVKTGDPVVTDIKAIQYKPDGSLKVKEDFSDNFSVLPRRIKTVSANDQPKQLYQSKIPIEARKFKHLQEMKKVLPRDVHHFYDNLPHYLPQPGNKICKPLSGQCPCTIP